MAIRTQLAALALLVPSVLGAANNWNTPCFNGKCAYDVAQSGPHGRSTGSLFIVRVFHCHLVSAVYSFPLQAGSVNAISDLTPAAGWTILDCSAGEMGQTIRAVCTGSHAACAHLYNGGAKNTIVRLPDSVSIFRLSRAY